MAGEIDLALRAVVEEIIKERELYASDGYRGQGPSGIETRTKTRKAKVPEKFSGEAKERRTIEPTVEKRMLGHLGALMDALFFPIVQDRDNSRPPPGRVPFK